MKRIDKIANMSFVCALLVVPIHVGPMREAVGDSGWWFRMLFANGLSSFAVGYFFLVSGYFLARHADEKGWWPRELKKRISSIVIPCFWCVALSLLLAFPLSAGADWIAGRPFGTSSCPFLTGHLFPLLGLNWGPPYHIHLWYLRLLMVFVLISPLLVFLVRRFPFVFLLCIPLASYCNHGFELVFNFGSLFQFSLGMYLAIHRVRIPLERYRAVFVFIAVLAVAVKVGLAVNGHPWPGLMNWISSGLLMAAVWTIIPNRPWPLWLTSCAFPIYLYHWVFLAYPKVLFDRLWGDCYNALPSALASILAIAMSLIFALFLKRYLPRFAQICFGGRCV